MVNYMVAPVTGNDVGIRRAEIKQGIREIILCKDQDKKIGLRLKSVDNVSMRIYAFKMSDQLTPAVKSSIFMKSCLYHDFVFSVFPHAQYSGSILICMSTWNSTPH